jgi:hypothetical protein
MAPNNDTFYLVITVTWHNGDISNISDIGKNFRNPECLSGLLIFNNVNDS